MPADIYLNFSDVPSWTASLHKMEWDTLDKVFKRLRLCGLFFLHKGQRGGIRRRKLAGTVCGGWWCVLRFCWWCDHNTSYHDHRRTEGPISNLRQSSIFNILRCKPSPQHFDFDYITRSRIINLSTSHVSHDDFHQYWDIDSVGTIYMYMLYNNLNSEHFKQIFSLLFICSTYQFADPGGTRSSKKVKWQPNWIN